MSTYIHARLEVGRDDDLIKWLGTQPTGKRSAAIRELLREGLQTHDRSNDLRQLVQEAVTDALGNVQLKTSESSSRLDESETEDMFGDKLDRLLGGFG